MKLSEITILTLKLNLQSYTNFLQYLCLSVTCDIDQSTYVRTVAQKHQTKNNVILVNEIN